MLVRRGVALLVVVALPATGFAQSTTSSIDLSRARSLLSAPATSLDFDTSLTAAGLLIQIDPCDASKAEGRRYARETHKSTAWWSTALVGFFLPIIGIGISTGIAFGSRPEPKTIASNVDVDCYRDGYRGAARKKNVLTALGASALGTVAVAAILAISGGFVVFPTPPTGMPGPPHRSGSD